MLKYRGTKRGTPTEKEQQQKNMVSKWVEYDPSASQQESTSLTCHFWNVAPEKRYKVENHSHILGSMGLFESLRLKQGFSSSSLKKTKEALKICIILDRDILEKLLFWTLMLSQGTWNPSVYHNPWDWALSQYVKVVEIKKQYSFSDQMVIYLLLPRSSEAA